MQQRQHNQCMKNTVHASMIHCVQLPCQLILDKTMHCESIALESINYEKYYIKIVFQIEFHIIIDIFLNVGMSKFETINSMSFFIFSPPPRHRKLPSIIQTERLEILAKLCGQFIWILVYRHIYIYTIFLCVTHNLFTHIHR